MRLIVFFLLLCFSLGAQEEPFFKGLAVDDEGYEESMMRAPLLSRDYQSLPASHSLKAWCPAPKSQGSYGTCTAWSIAYAARTILEAQQKGWNQASAITPEAFDPGFIYYHIKYSYDSNCEYGSSIDNGLELLRTRGVPKLKDNGTSCLGSLPSGLYSLAAPYKIKGYNRLYSLYDGDNYKIQSVKKALTENSPVVIGMVCPNSFSRASGVWQPNESNNWMEHGGHAMCVIGYDDGKYGGAFEVMNSWGTNWGNNGFIWIRYSDFAYYVKYAYEVYPAQAPAPPKPAVQLAGGLGVALADGVSLQPSFKTGASLITYQLKEKILEGTRYRIFLQNDHPAYVYVLGGDQGGSLSRLFPHKGNISPYLAYASSRVAIPGEEWYIEAGEPQGKDYLWVIYSKEKLDMEDIVARFESAAGAFPERAAAAVKGIALPPASVSCQASRIEFSSTSQDQKAVSLIVEMNR